MTAAAIETPSLAIAYVLAGAATVTLASPSGNHFTYRVQRAKGRDVWFVQLRTGPDGEDYRYLGTIFEGTRFVWTAKSCAGRDAASFKAFDWTFRRLVADVTLQGVEVMHAGTCGRCGRELTNPESVRTGLGPVCSGKVAA